MKELSAVGQKVGALWNRLCEWLNHVEPELSRFLSFVALLSFGLASTQLKEQGEPQAFIVVGAVLLMTAFGIRVLSRWPSLRNALCEGEQPDEKRIAVGFDEPFATLIAVLFCLAMIVFLGTSKDSVPLIFSSMIILHRSR